MRHSDSDPDDELWAAPAHFPSDLFTPPKKISDQHQTNLTKLDSNLSPFLLSSISPYPLSLPSPNVESLSPIPTIYDLMNESMMTKKIPNPYVVPPSLWMFTFFFLCSLNKQTYTLNSNIIPQLPPPTLSPKHTFNLIYNNNNKYHPSTAITQHWQ